MGILREPTAWIVILVVILLFGAKRLPDVARGLGRSARILKAETEGLRTDDIPSDGPLPTQAVTAAPVVTPTPVIPAAPQPAAQAPRYLVDPITGEQILAQPVTPPADGAPRV